mmetsp:Transcript_4706/g.9856  ORF Transcript_4706/g.9856 Transcript_4706/m.9856 type:complete len:481 (+) Transcript_4706:45-1487(+)
MEGESVEVQDAAENSSSVDRGIEEHKKRKFLRFLRFFGPAFFVSIGGIDPGNFTTDIEAGSKYGMSLLWVLLVATVIAVIVQVLAARIGIATGQGLAGVCCEYYTQWISKTTFLVAFIAIISTILACLLGGAVGLQMLTGAPVAVTIIVCAGILWVSMFLHRLGARVLELVVAAFLFSISICFSVELTLIEIHWEEVAKGFIPSNPGSEGLLVAVGLFGACVMPHNIYLHSSLLAHDRHHRPAVSQQSERSCINKSLCWVQHKIERAGQSSMSELLQFSVIDSIVAFGIAFFVSVCLIIISAAAFFENNQHEVVELQQAKVLLGGLLQRNAELGAVLFGIALFVAGHSSAMSGVMAGRNIVSGFFPSRPRPLTNDHVLDLLHVLATVAIAFPITVISSDEHLDTNGAMSLSVNATFEEGTAVGDASTYLVIILTQVRSTLKLCKLYRSKQQEGCAIIVLASCFDSISKILQRRRNCRVRA